jgi:hypothetical protein
MKYVLLYLYDDTIVKIILKTMKIWRVNDTKLKTQLIRLNKKYKLIVMEITNWDREVIEL